MTWWTAGEAFTTSYSDQESGLVTKTSRLTRLVRKANENLQGIQGKMDCGDRNSIIGVPEYEFVRAEEAYALAELPLGESRDIHLSVVLFGWVTLTGSTNDWTFHSIAEEDYESRASGGRGKNRNPPAHKVINMVNVHSSKRKKRKDREATEYWMNTPISFPPIMTDDASDEPLIVEAEVEGYLVRRVYVDEGSSVEVMFEHYFENLSEKVKAGLRETRTDLVGFARGG
ncbi:hypothetical protein Tco_0243033 [Tanacetum coccineum]